MHVPKTAGSSLNRLFCDYFGDDVSLPHLESAANPKELDISRYYYVSGHIRFLEIIHQFDLRPFCFISLVRSPIDQLCSHLRWLRFVSEVPRGSFFKAHTETIQKVSLKMRKFDFSKLDELEAYVESFEHPENFLFHNCQTRYFIPNYTTERVVDRDCESAMKAIDRFDYVGCLEDLDAFFTHLTTQGFALKCQDFNRENENRLTYGLDPTNDDVVSLLTPLLSRDQLIYDYVTNKVW